MIAGCNSDVCCKRQLVNGCFTCVTIYVSLVQRFKAKETTKRDQDEP